MPEPPTEELTKLQDEPLHHGIRRGTKRSILAGAGKFSGIRRTGTAAVEPTFIFGSTILGAACPGRPRTNVEGKVSMRLFFLSKKSDEAENTLRQEKNGKTAKEFV